MSDDHRADLEDIPGRIAEYINDMTQGAGARATVSEVNAALSKFGLVLQELLRTKTEMFQLAAHLRNRAHRLARCKSVSIAYKESLHHHGSTLEAIARSLNLDSQT